MKKWNEISNKVHDASGIEYPSMWLWEQKDGVYYPVKEIKTVKITEDEFYEKYNPIKNHLDPNAAFDGCMFETYGKECDHINWSRHDEINKSRIWTILDVEGALYFVSGYHFVNRFGYLITEESVPEDIEYEVRLYME